MKRPRLKSTEIKKGVTCGPGDSQIEFDLKTLKCIEILKLMLQNQKCIRLKKGPRLKYPPIDWNKKGVTCGPGDRGTLIEIGFAVSNNLPNKVLITSCLGTVKTIKVFFLFIASSWYRTTNPETTNPVLFICKQTFLIEIDFFVYLEIQTKINFQ